VTDNKSDELRGRRKDRDVPVKRSWERPIVRKESIASITQKSGRPSDSDHGTS